MTSSQDIETLRRSGTFDADWYLKTYPDVQALGMDPIEHYLWLGARLGRRMNPEDNSEPLSTNVPLQTVSLDHSQAPSQHTLRPAGAVHDKEMPLIENITTIKFPWHEQPHISIIIPTYGKWHHTARCVASIAKQLPTVPFEIIITEDASGEPDDLGVGRIPGVSFLSQGANIGFLKNCNSAASLARGRFLHFLNNDTEVFPGWLDALAETFNAVPNCGLVGSKLIFPSGQLQEAGGIIWQDGSAWNWGRLKDPEHCAFNYVRDVDYISGASIMISAELFKTLGMFDLRYVPAYYEDTDLAMAVRKAGLRVVYQPFSRVVHHEGISSGLDESTGAKRYQSINRYKFLDKWDQHLRRLTPNGHDPYLSCDRLTKNHILIVDACTPTPDQDSGSLDMFNLIKIFVNLGWRVHFIPLSNFAHFGSYTEDLQRLGVECIYAPHYSSLDSYLRERGDMFTLCLLARVGVADQALPAVTEHCPSAKTIFYTVDLHFLREMRAAQLSAEACHGHQCSGTTKEVELALMDQVDSTVILSEVEYEMLSTLGKKNLTVLPLIREIEEPVVNHYTQRNGVVFIGGFNHQPNVDAVEWLAEAIWPEVRKIIAERHLSPIPLYIIGSKMPERFRAMNFPDIEPIGFVQDIRSIFERVRLSVAPLRFGAGLKGKIASSFMMGIPVVGTDVAFEGMPKSGLEDVRFEATTPQGLAKLIVDLHQSDELDTLGRKCRDYVLEHYSTQKITQSVNRLIDDVLARKKES